MKTYVKTDRNRLIVAGALLLFALIATVVLLAIHGLIIPVLIFLEHTAVIVGVFYLLGSSLSEFIRYKENRDQANHQTVFKKLYHQIEVKPKTLPSIKTMKR